MVNFDYKEIIEKLSNTGQTGNTSVAEELIRIQKLKIKRESLKKLILEFINEIDSNGKEQQLYQIFKYNRLKYKILKNWRISFGLASFLGTKKKIEEFNSILPLKKLADGKEYYDIEAIIELLKELKIFISVKKDEDQKYLVVKRYEVVI